MFAVCWLLLFLVCCFFACSLQSRDVCWLLLCVVARSYLLEVVVVGLLFAIRCLLPGVVWCVLFVVCCVPLFFCCVMLVDCCAVLVR